MVEQGAVRRRGALLAGGAVLVAVVLAAAAWAWWPDGAGDAAALDPAQAAAISSAVSSAVAAAVGDDLTVAQVHDKVAPSLVLVQVQRSGAAGGATGDDEAGLGSGVIVKDDGTVLTALHVVDGATRIELTFADGSTSGAEVVDAQPERDIATLAPATPPSIVVPAVLGSAGALKVGDPAIAIGHPLGLVGSTTAGVVSGLGRSVPVEATGVVLQDLIQFDAAVNPGSSGGPLLNAHGEVVGIVTALANPSGQRSFTGIGFAVPIGEAVGGGGGGPVQ